MTSRYWMVAVVALILSAGGAHALVVSANSGDCEQKREYCIKSCLKQRKDCDAKGNSSDYCVKQDEACSNGCNKAWNKCSQKTSSSTSIELVGKIAL